jgi:hypothetical protein
MADHVSRFRAMDSYVKHLILLRDDLRQNAILFCDLINANACAIERNDVAMVRNLIESAMSAIEDMPIAW